MWRTFAQQNERQRPHEAPQRRQKGILSAATETMQSQKNDLQPHIYNPLELCIARIVPTSGSPMVPINNEEDERSTVIRGKTEATTSEAKPAARTQPMSALPGFLLLSVLLF